MDLKVVGKWVPSWSVAQFTRKGKERYRLLRLAFLLFLCTEPFRILIGGEKQPVLMMALNRVSLHKHWKWSPSKALPSLLIVEHLAPGISMYERDCCTKPTGLPYRWGIKWTCGLYYYLTHCQARKVSWWISLTNMSCEEAQHCVCVGWVTMALCRGSVLANNFSGPDTIL